MYQLNVLIINCPHCYKIKFETKNIAEALIRNSRMFKRIDVDVKLLPRCGP